MADDQTINGTEATSTAERVSGRVDPQVRRRRVLWALTGFWEGSPCAIQHGGYVPPFAVWMEVDQREFDDLRKKGFYTRRCASRPTDYIDRDDQRGTPRKIAEWRD